MLSQLIALILYGNQIVINKNEMMIERHQETIDKLIWCESSDRDITNPHDGGSPSYSYLQWKVSTWNYFLDKYDLFPFADKADRENLMHDRWANKLVAAYVLEEKNGWKNWYNCSIKLGLNK